MLAFRTKSDILRGGMARESEPPTTDGMTLEEAKAFLERQTGAIGEPLEEIQEVTRALNQAELGLPDDDDGDTLQREVQSDKVEPAETTLQRTLVLDPPAPASPVTPSLIDDDPVPVTEGTAILPRDFLLKGVALEPHERSEVLPGPLPPITKSPPQSPEPVSEPTVLAVNPPSRPGRPWLVGVIVFAISLVLFGTAALAYLRGYLEFLFRP